MAKVVMLKVDGKLVMAVVTGNRKIHLPTARVSLAAYEVSLATEDEFYSKFPHVSDRAVLLPDVA